jgi:Skp family chaperone for outer membrane proteins
VVKQSLLVAAMVTMTLGVTSRASAQNQAQIDRGVAVVDLKYIFDNFEYFKGEKAKIDNDIKLAEAEVATEKKNVEQLKDHRDLARKGTPEYINRDAQLTRAQTELTVKVAQTRKKFVEREANLYFTSYKIIVAQVEEYANWAGFSMVLRYNKDLLDSGEETDARKVALQLNKPVVWIRPNSNQLYDQNNRDITAGVLDALRRRMQRPEGATRQAPGVPQRQ